MLFQHSPETSGYALHWVTPVASYCRLPWTPDKSINHIRCYIPCWIFIWLSAAPFAYHGSGIITRCGHLRLPWLVDVGVEDCNELRIATVSIQLISQPHRQLPADLTVRSTYPNILSEFVKTNSCLLISVICQLCEYRIFSILLAEFCHLSFWADSLTTHFCLVLSIRH